MSLGPMGHMVPFFLFIWNSEHVDDACQAHKMGLACVMYMLGVPKVMYQLGENVITAFYGLFLSDFLIFFLLNVIYLGYDIRLRSFASLR